MKSQSWFVLEGSQTNNGNLPADNQASRNPGLYWKALRHYWRLVEVIEESRNPGLYWKALRHEEECEIEYIQESQSWFVLEGSQTMKYLTGLKMIK